MNTNYRTRKISGIFSIIKSLIFFSILLSQESCSTYHAFNTVFNREWDSDQALQPGEPRLEYQNSIPVIHLYGSSYEMGKQYGELLHKPLESLSIVIDKFFPDKKKEKYIQLSKKVEPMLSTEVLSFIRGMSESSGMDYRILLALNTVPKTTCSVLATWGEASANGNLIMGRNADYKFKKINKSLGLIVVKHPDNGYSSVASSFLGLAGTFTGINEKGVCYGNMLVYNGFENEYFTKGIPIQLAMQQAAEKSNTANEMIEHLLANKHLTPVNVMCADNREALLAELGQDNSAIRKGEKGVLAATNYFYSENMYKDYVNDLRFSILMQSVHENYGTFNLDILQEAMHAARRKGRNLQCILFDPANMKIHVSMNKVPASKGPFYTFDINELLKN